jgi:hypothetical protein
VGEYLLVVFLVWDEGMGDSEMGGGEVVGKGSGLTSIVPLYSM